MGEVLVGAGVMACVVGIGLIAMTWIIWRKMRRHNEVCAARPNRPPLRWLVSPGTCARLHRRLRDAVIGLRRAVPARRRWSRREWTPLEILASEIVAQAVSIDHGLLVLARTRRPAGAEERAKAARRVEEIERAAHRLAAASLQAAGHEPASTEAALRRISSELDARESAWQELTLLEHEAGLGQPA